MAKKDSIYRNVNLDVVKRELIRNVDYLMTISIENINDDIREYKDFREVMVPRIIASLEQKLDSYIVLIKESIEQLHTIMKIEMEVTEEMGVLLDHLENHMKSIETYFEKRPPEEIIEREHTITTIKKKKDNKTGEYTEYPSITILLAANIPTQIKYRAKIQKIILGLLPIINDIREGRKDPKLLKGDKDYPIAMLFKRGEL